MPKIKESSVNYRALEKSKFFENSQSIPKIGRKMTVLGKEKNARDSSIGRIGARMSYKDIKGSG
jgi:hypothetical protein